MSTVLCLPFIIPKDNMDKLVVAYWNFGSWWRLNWKTVETFELTPTWKA